MSKCWLGWAVERPGMRLFVQFGGNESDAWEVALGWPHASEIAEAKAGGARAFPVRIVEDINDGR